MSSFIRLRACLVLMASALVGLGTRTGWSQDGGPVSGTVAFLTGRDADRGDYSWATVNCGAGRSSKAPQVPTRRRTPT